MDYMGFRDLECYKEGRMLRLSVSKLVKKLPQSERYLLISQLLRASRGITSNIAEGYGRFTYKETRNFFIISRGSTTEVMEHITVCFDEDYISKEEYTQLEQQCVLVFKLVNGYINYLDRRKDSKK